MIYHARIIRVLAWASLIAIAIVTLGPLGMRPSSGLPPQVERFLAFVIIGGLFAAGYPRYLMLTAAIVIGAAVVLELLQLIAPARHGRALDAGVKIAGGVIGLVAGSLFARLTRPRSTSF